MATCVFNDGHFHFTNYVQKGTDAAKYVDEIMGDKVCRSTLFGIPLQQTWSHGNSGEFAPTYYLQTDAPALLLLVHRCIHRTRVPEAETRSKQARLDPMITGFNPADMYAADHIRRVLETYPGVFTGIGEFTIHKEFVSSKVAGEVASLTDPALDRILEFAGEVGLVVILHNDIDMPFAKAGAEPVYLTQMKDLLRRHPRTTIIWAHTGSAGSSTRSSHRPGPEAAERSAERIWKSCRRCSRTRRSPTCISTSRGTRSPSTPYRRRRPTSGGGGDAEPSSGSLPVRHRQRGAERTRRRRCAYTTCGTRSGSSSRPRPVAKCASGTYERLFDAARIQRPRVGSGERQNDRTRSRHA